MQTDDNGLQYMRGRYYNSDIKRFINSDPVKDGLNWYTYVNGNPISFIEANGYWSTWGEIGTAVGIADVTAIIVAGIMVATLVIVGLATTEPAFAGISGTALTTTVQIAGTALATNNIMLGANSVAEVFTGKNYLANNVLGGNYDASDELTMSNTTLIYTFVTFRFSNAFVNKGFNNGSKGSGNKTLLSGEKWNKYFQETYGANNVKWMPQSAHQIM